MKTSLFWVYTALWQWKIILYWKSNKLEAPVICCWQPHLYLGVAWLTGAAGFPWVSLPLGSAVGFTLLCGRRHLPLCISLGPVLLLQTVSQVPASQGIGLSVVVSHKKSVEIPFCRFPTQQLSLKVRMELKFILSYLLKFQCHYSSVTTLSKVQTALEGSRGIGGDDQGVHFYCIPGRNPALKPLLKKPNS